MAKRVILLTGTPCVGKTSVAKQLTHRLDALNVNLTDLTLRENLVAGKDEERDSAIVDEERMRKRIRRIIEGSDKGNVVIDGYYAASVVSPRLVSRVFVLRRDPRELRGFMKRKGFSERKLVENLASEILDVCLVDALSIQNQKKVCEIDASGKNAGQVADKIIDILNGRSECRVGIVDWLGKLESEGVLDEFLRI
jgi:adenylate kinase